MPVRTVSYSELDTYRQCRLKHQLSYLELWDQDETPAPLARGTLFHSVMEEHYRSTQELGLGARNAMQRVLSVPDLLQEEGTASQTDEQMLVEWVYRGYVERYAEQDEQWKIVAIEQPVDSWLPTSRGTRSMVKLAGTADLIVRDQSAGGGLWVVDHKTCRYLPKGKDLDLEDQTGIYAWLLRKHGFNIRGAIYNHCRTNKLKTRELEMDERFKRSMTVRTDTELETVAVEAYELMMEAYRKRQRQDAPRSPDSERCGWKCSFTEACLVGRKGGDMRGYLEDTGFTQQETKPGPTFKRLAEGATGDK